LNLLQTYLAQHSNPTLAALQVQPAVTTPQIPKMKKLKGIKGYPDVWQQVLIYAKDIT
jgi:hypothetical protein